ncbi:MAG: LptA/OstA family protein, partial [Pseudomonadota bacterium]
LITSADGQSATGDTGTVNFDDRTMSLNGNVTLTQDGNVVTGDTLTVSLDTGIARVQSRGRVRVLLTPGGARPATD